MVSVKFEIHDDSASQNFVVVRSDKWHKLTVDHVTKFKSTIQNPLRKYPERFFKETLFPIWWKIFFSPTLTEMAMDLTFSVGP